RRCVAVVLSCSGSAVLSCCRTAVLPCCVVLRGVGADAMDTVQGRATYDRQTCDLHHINAERAGPPGARPLHGCFSAPSRLLPGYFPSTGLDSGSVAVDCGEEGLL